MAGGCRAIASGFRGIRIGHGNRPKNSATSDIVRSPSPLRGQDQPECAVTGEVVHHRTHSFEELVSWARCELSIDVTASVSVSMQQLVEAVGAPGKLQAANGKKRYASPRTRPRKTMKIESLTLNVIVLFAVLFDCGIGSASATDFCIELTTTEINHRQERRGDANACAGDESSDIKNAARDLARSNASNAIASRCLNDVTLTIGQQACARISLVANTSPNNLWTDFPSATKPNADNVRYVDRGVGGNARVSLCAVARDVRVRTHSVVGGNCRHDIGLLPHRNFATARARA